MKEFRASFGHEGRGVLELRLVSACNVFRPGRSQPGQWDTLRRGTMTLHANPMLEEQRTKPLNDPRPLRQHSRIVERVPPESSSVAAWNVDGEDLIAANKIGKSVGVDAAGLCAGSSKPSSTPVENDYS